MANRNGGSPSRALVLGGGGVTGSGWEVGVLAGLLEAGVDLRGADTVIGTSAGAFVGAAFAGGQDVEEMYAAQLRPDDTEPVVAASRATVAAWYEAFAVGGCDRHRVGAAFGAIAKADPEPVPLALRREVVRSRLSTAGWPAALKVTAIDADTGQLRAFDQESGIPLVDAVSASGAVPGVWPLERIDGRPWIDGGMVSSANALLAGGHDRIIVIAPLPNGYGQIPGAAEDAAVLREHAQVHLVVPDEAGVAAIGPNIYDPQRRRPAALAGRTQGIGLAGALEAMWYTGRTHGAGHPE
ncbi:patatin-like phospholipase family protein [Streptomyces sp. NPDC050485]|uniref:patatin-like phospholipase family protein n=1 Tax=Streptomyces sp. NPDC050485 TaxID=3365617 RepID=UPI0037954481